MPIIRVSCLPAGLTEEGFQGLFWDIIAAVSGVEELGLKNEKDMTVLFPPDGMKWGLGTDIVVEILGLFEKPERTEGVRNRLAQRVGEAVKKRFPSSYVECLVQTFNPKDGFWDSSKS